MLEALSKLKMAGKLHYWRGTIEINERELHAICDEIQAEHDKVVAAMNKATGNWARADAELREHDGTRWHELFGTPKRAARTLTHVCQFTHGGELCDRCQCYLFGNCDRTLRLMSERKIYDALLEWLMGDA